VLQVSLLIVFTISIVQSFIRSNCRLHRQRRAATIHPNSV